MHKKRGTSVPRAIAPNAGFPYLHVLRHEFRADQMALAGRSTLPELETSAGYETIPIIVTRTFMIIALADDHRSKYCEKSSRASLKSSGFPAFIEKRAAFSSLPAVCMQAIRLPLSLWLRESTSWKRRYRWVTQMPLAEISLIIQRISLQIR